MLPTMDLHAALPAFSDVISMDEDCALLKENVTIEDHLLPSLDDHEFDTGFLMIVDDVDEGPFSLGLLEDVDHTEVSVDTSSVTETLALQVDVTPSTPEIGIGSSSFDDYAYEVTPEGSVSEFDDIRIKTPDLEEMKIQFSVALESFAESMRRSESTHRRLAKRKRPSEEDIPQETKGSNAFWKSHKKVAPFFKGTRPTLTPELEQSRQNMWNLVRSASTSQNP